jgi:hypothetical protein
MNIPAADFVDILWNIHQIPIEISFKKKFGEQFSAIFPHLRNKDQKESSRLVRYVIYLYDIKTPLRDYYKNITQRREAALTLSGYNNKQLDPSKRMKAIEATTPVVIDTIHSFIKYQNNRDYSQLILCENSFWDYQQMLTVPIDRTADKKEIERREMLRKECRSLQDEISNIEYKIFGADKETINLVKEARRMRTRPEHMAI